MYSPHSLIKSYLYIFASDFKTFIVNYKTRNECILQYKRNTLVTTVQVKRPGHLPLEALHGPFPIHKPFPSPQSNHFSDFYRTHQRETFYFDLRQRERERNLTIEYQNNTTDK